MKKYISFRPLLIITCLFFRIFGQKYVRGSEILISVPSVHVLFWSVFHELTLSPFLVKLVCMLPDEAMDNNCHISGRFDFVKLVWPTIFIWKCLYPVRTLRSSLSCFEGERALEFVLGLYGLSPLILFLLLLSHSLQIIGVQLQNCCEKRHFKWFLHIQDFLGASAAFFNFNMLNNF